MGVVSIVLMLNFLQEIKKLKKTNAESKQVKILELRRKVAYWKQVRDREKHESVRMPDSVCHVVGSGSRYWQWGVNTRGWLQ